MKIFLTSLFAIIKIFLITVAGYFFFKIKIFKKLYKPLLFYTINISIPILILYRLITKFNFNLFIETISLPLYGLLLIWLGYFLGKKFAPFLNIPAQKRNVFVSIMMFSNCGYLPLPLFESIFKGDDIALSQIYVFFIGLVYTSLIWSIGVNMLTHSDKILQKTRFKLTVPFCAVIAGIFLSFLNVKNLLVPELESLIKIITKSGVLLVMFIMGGGLSSVNLSHIKIDNSVIFITLFKLIVLPLLVVPVIFIIKMNPVLKTVFIVEAGVPPAVNLVIITLKYGKSKNIDFLLSSMISTYIVSIFTLSFLIFISHL